MGQIVGKPLLHPSVGPYSALPKKAIECIWASYNLLGEAWGLALEDLQSILQSSDYFAEVVGYDADAAKKLFTLFDTDNNGIVDALELVIGLGIVSGIDVVEKIIFTFSVYDFDSRLSLSWDEVSLMLRSVVKSCAKMFPSYTLFASIKDSDVEEYVSFIFAESRKVKGERVAVADFQNYALSHPVFSNWLDCLSMNQVVVELNNGSSKPGGISSTCFSSADDSLIKPTSGLSIELAAASSEAPAWFASADSMNPNLPRTEESPPLVQRLDPSEDVIEPLWIHGINTSNIKGSAVSYVCGDNSVLYAASRFLILLKRKTDEESGSVTMTQQVKFEHQTPISSIELSTDSQIAVTTESSFTQSGLAINGADLSITKQQVNIWRLSPELALDSSLSFSWNTRIVMTSLSSDNSKLLILSEELNGGPAFASIYDLSTRKMTFNVALRHKCDDIVKISFAHSSTIFSVVSKSSGVSFFVEEGFSSLGNGGQSIYSLREAIFPIKDMKSIDNLTSIIRTDYPDEFITGSADGSIQLWQFRSCVQTIKSHSSAVSGLSFCGSSQSIVSVSTDGTIAVLKLKKPTNARHNRKTLVRSIEQASLIDLSRHTHIQINSITSVSTAFDSSKVLIATTNGEAFELSLTGPDWKPEVKVVAVEGEEGAKGGDVVEEGAPVVKLGDDINKGPLLTSHSGSVSSVAKTAGGFISIGSSDGSLKLWNAAEGPQKVVKSIALTSPCSRIAAGGSYVAASAASTGSVYIYSLPDLVFVTELNENTSVVRDLKISSDNSLVFSTADSNIFIYTAGTDAASWLKKASFPSPHVAERFDISSDGAFVRIMGASQELSVLSIGGETVGAPLTVPETLKGLSFASSSVLYAWDTKGVFNHFSSVGQELTKIPTSDRSNALFLTGHDDGSLVLTRLPAFEYLPNENQTRPSLTRVLAHDGSLSSLSFIEEGAKLVTAGSADGLIIVWKVTYDAEEAEIEPVPAEGEGEETKEEEEEDPDKPKSIVIVDSDDEEDLKDGESMRRHLTKKTSVSAAETVSKFSGDIGLDTSSLSLNSTIVAEKVQYLRESLVDYAPVLSKGAKRGIAKRAADKQKKQVVQDATFDDLPEVELQPHWVFGYSARTAKNSLKYNGNGSIVYPAGSNIIIYDKLEHKQIIVSAHFDLVTSIDIHIGSNTAVSSHAGANDIRIAVWNANTGEIQSYLSCGSVNGVSALTISPCGRFVAAACLDKTHSVLIFDLLTSELRSKIPVGSKKIWNITFSQAPGPIRLLVGGVGHFALLDARFGRAFSIKNGLYGQGNKKVDITSAASLPLAVEGGNEFVVGLSNGQIGVIGRGDRRISSYFPVQKGVVNCVAVIKVKDATADEPSPVYKIVTGGVDGNIKVLDMEGQPTNEFNPYKPIPAPEGVIPALTSTYNLHDFGRGRGFRGFCLDKSSRKLLFGTCAGEIGEMEIETGIDTNEGKGPLVVAHFRGELKALAAHPIRQEVISVGDDKVLRIWQLSESKMVNQIDLPDKATCATYSPNGHLIAAGLIKRENKEKTGCVIVSYLQSKLQVVHVTSDNESDVTSAVWTPDGKQFWVGDKNGVVRKYDPLNNFCLISTSITSTEEESTGVRSFDVSSDSSIIVSLNDNGRSIYWDATQESLTRIDDKSKIDSFLAKPSYFVRSGIAGREAIGIFQSDSSFSNTTSLDLSKSGSYLVSGDSFGQIRLFKSPTTTLTAPHKSFHLHSAGGVSRVAFTMQDLHVISSGVSDRTVVIWKVVNSESPKASGLLPVVSYLPRGAMHKINSAKIIEEDNDETSNFAASFTINGVSFASAGSGANRSVDATLTSTFGVGSNSFIKPVSDNVYLKHELDSTVMKILTEDDVNDAVGTDAAVASTITSDSIDGESSTNVKKSAKQVKPLRYSSNLFSLPVARYCGSLDVVTNCGKFASVIRRAGGKSSRMVLGEKAASFDDIGAITTSSCSKFVATGTAAPWDSSSLVKSQFAGSVDIYQSNSYSAVCSIKGSFFGGVSSIAFSNDSTFLAVLCGDVEHTVHIIRSLSGKWDDTELIAKSSTSLSEMTLVTFLEGNNTSASCHLAVAGAGGLVWLVVKGHLVSSRVESAFIDGSKLVGITSLAAMPIDKSADLNTFTQIGFWLVTGHHDGKVVAWTHPSAENSSYQIIGTHSGPVSSLSSYYWSSELTTSSVPAESNDGSMSPKSKVVKKLRTQQSTKMGIVSGSSDKITIFDSRTLSSVQDIAIDQLTRPNSYSSGLNKLFVNSEDKECFVNSISSDSKFKKIVVALSTSQIIEVALDSLAVHLISSGDNRVVNGFTCHPSVGSIIVNFTSDNSINVWNKDTQTMIGQITIPNRITAVEFASNNLLFVGCVGNNAISGANHTSTSGSVSIVSLSLSDSNQAASLSVIETASAIGHGSLFSFRISPDQTKVTVCSEDGNVYLFRANELSTITAGPSSILTLYGALKVYGSHHPVSSDFSTCGSFVRSFSALNCGDKIVNVDFFDISGVEASVSQALIEAQAQAEADNDGSTPVAILTYANITSYLTQVGKRQSTEAELTYIKTNIQWSTSSSPACPDLRGLYLPAMSNKHSPIDLVSHSVSNDKSIVAASYSDGSIKLYNYPVSCESTPILELNCHLSGDVIVSFAKTDSFTLETYGKTDGVWTSWKLLVK